MSDDDFDSQAENLIERYLQFLRGQAPEPDLGHLSAARRRAVRARLDLVDAMFGLDLHRPPVELDPVAIRLGLVPDPSAPSAPGSDPSPSGSSHPDPSPADPSVGGAATSASADGSSVSADRVHADGSEQQLDAVVQALEELETAFSGQVVIEWSPTWSSWRGGDLQPLAQCSVLGDALAIFVDHRPWNGHNPVEQPDALTAFLYQHPDVSAVSVVSGASRQAAILPAAACHTSIDPVRGWLRPGELVITDDVDLVLGRYFEARLPRWERVAGLSDMLARDDVGQQVLDTVTHTIDAALRTRPRLEHKKDALQALRAVDPHQLATAVIDVRSGDLAGAQLLERLETLAVGDGP